MADGLPKTTVTAPELPDRVMNLRPETFEALKLLFADDKRALRAVERVEACQLIEASEGNSYQRSELVRAGKLVQENLEAAQSKLLNAVGGQRTYSVIMNALDNARARSVCYTLDEFMTACADPASPVGGYFGDDGLDVYFKLHNDAALREQTTTAIRGLKTLCDLKADFEQEFGNLQEIAGIKR
jgi:hypothetical protein